MLQQSDGPWFDSGWPDFLPKLRTHRAQLSASGHGARWARVFTIALAGVPVASAPWMESTTHPTDWAKGWDVLFVWESRIPLQYSTGARPFALQP